MRFQWTWRGATVVSAVGVGCATCGAAAFSPLARARLAVESARWHVTVEVDAVRPTWCGIGLHHVVVRPERMPGIELRADDVSICVNWKMAAERVEVAGGGVFASGAEAALRAQFDAWRRLHREGGTAKSAARHPIAVAVRDAAVLWTDGTAREPRIEASGLDLVFEREAAQFEIARARARSGQVVITLSHASAGLAAAGALDGARADALMVEWHVLGEEPSSGPGTSDALRTRAVLDEARADPTARILPLPDVPSLWAKVTRAADLLNGRVAPGAAIGVGSATWKISRADDPVALTLGPGPLSVERSVEGLDVRYSTDPGVAGTPLSLRVSLSSRGGDQTAALEGGPISLAMLGVRDGALGLVDVGGATVTGRARFAMAGDGSSLTFDGEGSTTGLSLQSARLASDVVRGLDLQVRARALLASSGALRVDDFALSAGAIQLSGSGLLDQEPDHVTGAFRFQIPKAACRSLLHSVPAALSPVLQGLDMGGSFEANGHAEFDTRALDDLDLDYVVRDRCRVLSVPSALAPDQFRHPFTQRIVLPDGTLGDQSTGPGSSNWSSLDEISPYMQVAVLTTEDGGFFRHHGFNRASIRAAIIANLKARRFVRGASTITMQLAKNLFLAREKTLSRKLEEVVLTEYLEQTFAKDELMELYLNVIEFGPAVYGITAAADYYFGRTPAELNLAECLFLSSLLPAPLRYGAMREAGEVPEGWMRTIHTLMSIAHKLGRITDRELEEGRLETIAFWHGGDRPPARLPVAARPLFEGDSDDLSTIPQNDGQPGDPRDSLDAP
jgi:hypothetical protein